MFDITQYRVAIGCFLFRQSIRKLRSDFIFWSSVAPGYIYLWFHAKWLLARAGDIESNPGPPYNNNNITLASLNVRSLTSPTGNSVSKLDLINLHCSSNSIDIIGLCETWLDDSIHNNDILIPGYLPPLRRDRNRHGGGVAVYIGDTLNAKRCPLLEPDSGEFICIDLYDNFSYYMICFFYRPSNTPVADFTDGISFILSRAEAAAFSNFFFLGDSNSKNKAWCSSDNTCPAGKNLKLFFADSNCIQIIDSPTRFSAFSHSCIDHIFTNMSSHIITDSGVLPRDVCFDHSPVFVNIRLNSNIKNKSYKRKVWNFKNADFDKSRTTLQNISWNDILSINDVNETTSIFMENIIKAAEACIPRYDITVRPKDKPWFSGDLRRLIRRRNIMFHRWRREPDNLRLRHFYVELRNFMLQKQGHPKLSTNLFQKLNEINLSNSKSWWHTCKTLMNKKPVINSPLSINGELISDNLKKADLFNDHFIKQSSIDESNVRIPYLPRFCNTNIPTETVESSEVFKILNTTNINKATGPDQIGNRILKESSPVLAEPLSKLFNILICSGIFPSSWKRAHMSFLYIKVVI